MLPEFIWGHGDLFVWAPNLLGICSCIFFAYLLFIFPLCLFWSVYTYFKISCSFDFNGSYYSKNMVGETEWGWSWCELERCRFRFLILKTLLENLWFPLLGDLWSQLSMSLQFLYISSPWCHSSAAEIRWCSMTVCALAFHPFYPSMNSPGCRPEKSHISVVIHTILPPLYPC